MYRKFNDLKLQNRDLKTIIAIGGWNEGSEKFSISKTADGRKRFVDSVLEFLDRHGFDGLDMNWEYPSRRGGFPEDRENHALLLKELRDALDQENRTLIASVSLKIETVNVSYNAPEVMKSVHVLNVMGYDFFGAWYNYTGHNSPLRARKGGNELEQTLNVICMLRRSGGWKESRDPDVGAPVIVKEDQWIGYDDAESLKKKVSFKKDQKLPTDTEIAP
ncbi:unnamed protein product, partial [Ixodes persulcatus]